jgi:hypothetical protein
LTENNHIENCDELQTFIEENIPNTRAIQVSVNKKDLSDAPNVSAINNISSNYEYVWKPEKPPGNNLLTYLFW